MYRSWPYVIRLMEPGDVPTVVAIDRLSFPTPWPASSYLYELSHNTHAFYYVLLKPVTGGVAPSERGWRRWLRGLIDLPEESRVIGYMGFRLQDARAHVSTLAVHPDWRGRGLGELLLLTAMEHALELDVGAVTLEVRASNHVAHRLYRKYGFRFEGTHRGYYRDGEDAWLMGFEVNREACQARLAGLRQILEARLRRQQAGVGQNNEDTL
ncbi:MAG: ribosomal protein S18-alanine N-acetyltransferase [Chloroflexota bacterium]|nr:ribosomal protein S18-alanine N-acetyltransferase [Chloroflexota bacterium]